MHRTSNESSLLKKYIFNSRKPKRSNPDEKVPFVATIDHFSLNEQPEIPVDLEQNCTIKRSMRKMRKTNNLAATKELSFQVESNNPSNSSFMNSNTQQTSSVFQPGFKKQKIQDFTIQDQPSTANHSKASIVSHGDSCFSIQNSFSSQKLNCIGPSPQNLQGGQEEIEFIFQELENLFGSFEPTVNLKKGNFIPFKRKNLLEEYDIKERVGGGAFGTVYRCIHLATKAERTVKVIKKINLLNNRMKVRMEIDIIRKLDHPNVIKMYEAFEYDQTLYLILDYCRGGTLKSCMNDCHLPQHLNKQILRQIISGVNYIHQMGVIHRDLKPENIVFNQKIDENSHPDQISIKIIDFGLSILYEQKYFKDWKKIGTLVYLAPQVFSGVYSTKCDSWACGVIAHTLMLGFNPFFQEDAEHILKRISSYNLETAEKWSHLSKDQHKILQSLLNRNYFLREEVGFILNFSYFKESKPALTDREKKKILEKLKIFRRSRCSLIEIVHYYLSFNKISQKNLRKITKIFNALDVTNKGMISLEELQNFFLSEQRHNIQAIFREIDFNESGVIDFGEFVCVMTDKKELFTVGNIEELFAMIDTMEDGVIRKTELNNFLVRFGHSDKRQVESLFSQMDADHDNLISRQEFSWFIIKKIFFSCP